MRKYRCESDIYGKENWAVTRSVNPQVPGSSPGRGARIQKSPAFTGWAFCISGWFGIGSEFRIALNFRSKLHALFLSTKPRQTNCLASSPFEPFRVRWTATGKASALPEMSGSGMFIASITIGAIVLSYSLNTIVSMV